MGEELGISGLMKKISGPLLLKVYAAVIGLLFNFIATQVLSEQEFGLLSIAQVLLLVLVTLAKLGLDTTLVKCIAGNLETDNYRASHLVTVSWLVVLFSVGIICLLVYMLADLLAASVFKQPALLPVVPAILLIVLPNTFLTLSSGILKGHKKGTASVLFSGVLTMTLTSLLVFLFKPDTASEILNLMAYSAAASCIISFCVIIFGLKLSPALSKHAIYPLRISALPLWTASIVTLIIQQFSTLVLARYADVENVGIYALCVKIAALMAFVLFAVNVVAAPRFAALHAQNELEALRRFARLINRALLLVAALSGVILLLFASPILSLFGEFYVSGSDILRILVVGQMINIGTGAVVNLLIMSGHEKIHQRNTFFIAAMTVLLAFVLIPVYGMIGAALTTALAMSVQNLISLYFVRRYVFQSN